MPIWLFLKSENLIFTLSELSIESVTPKSVGRIIFCPLSEFRSSSALEINDSSSNDFPISYPHAFNNVKHIPPPTIRFSTFGKSFSIRLSLSEIFAPPRRTE